MCLAVSPGDEGHLDVSLRMKDIFGCVLGKGVLGRVTVDDDAALVGVPAFGVFCLTLVGALILESSVLDLQQGLAAHPLGGLRPIQLPPLDPGHGAVGKLIGESGLNSVLV